MWHPRSGSQPLTAQGQMRCLLRMLLCHAMARPFAPSHVQNRASCSTLFALVSSRRLQSDNMTAHHCLLYVNKHGKCQKHQCAEAQPDTKVSALVDIISNTDSEGEVLDWMAHNRIKRSELAEQRAEKGCSALVLAVRKHMLDVAKGCVLAHAAPNDADATGDAALHWACYYSREAPGMTDLMELLLEGGANPNAVGSLGNTPMHLAAAANCLMVRSSVSSTRTDAQQC